MSFKKWVMQRRALGRASRLGSNIAVQESYRKAVLSVAKLLRMQRAQTGDVKLVRKTGEANVKALGYIYGFADAAFQIAGMDIESECGVNALVDLIFELDRPNADVLWHRLKCPGDARALMDGVRLGFDDYYKLIRSEGTSNEATLSWVKCFHSS